MKILSRCLMTLVAVSLVSAAPAPINARAVTLLNDAGHGSVTGQFVLDGPIPAPVILVKKGDAGIKDAADDLAEGVEGRRGLPEVPVAAEVVGAQRVDRDEDDVRAAKDLPDLGFWLSTSNRAEREEEGESLERVHRGCLMWIFGGGAGRLNKARRSPALGTEYERHERPTSPPPLQRSGDPQLAHQVERCPRCGRRGG